LTNNIHLISNVKIYPGPYLNIDPEPGYNILVFDDNTTAPWPAVKDILGVEEVFIQCAFVFRNLDAIYMNKFDWDEYQSTMVLH